eukprot:39822-Amphidinium_carterae.1
MVWKALDAEYKLPAHRLSDESATKYERLRRRHGQTMSEYISAMKVAKATMERDDGGRISEL